MRTAVIVLIVAATAWTASVSTAGSAPHGAAIAEPDTFRIDPSHTHIGFAVRHLGIATVRGEFREASGLLLFDAADPTRSRVEVRIRTASLTTGNERRDADLRDAFLEVEAYPDIVFVSKHIARTQSGYDAVGELTLHGTTRPFVLPFEFAGPVPAPGGLLRIGVAAQARLDRRDFGLALQRMADNALVVGNEVRITIDVEFGRRS